MAARAGLMMNRVARWRSVAAVARHRLRVPAAAVRPLSGFADLLGASERSVLESERELLVQFHAKLIEMGTPEDELAILKDAISQMDQVFMICIVGEFNAG